MAFKLQFAGDSQHQGVASTSDSGACAAPDRPGNAEDVINPPEVETTPAREARDVDVSSKGADATHPPKRNNSSHTRPYSPAKDASGVDRKKNGTHDRTAGSSVESVRFSVLEIASLPIREFTSAIRDYERGVGVFNRSVRLMISHGMVEDAVAVGSVPEAKMGQHRDQMIRAYFLNQFGNLQSFRTVNPMTDLDPTGKYRKPVRPYHVYYDLFDYLREHASALRDYQVVLKSACRAILAYYNCVGSEDGCISAPVDIKDQKGGKLGDSPKAVAKFQATMKLCSKILDGGDVDATTLYDLANRMRLFCPGFAPKDWRSSVK